MKRVLLIAAALLFLAGSAQAATTLTYGWEDGETILGSYSSITATNDDEHVYSGSYSLKLVDGGESGTPQAYVAWITGLSDGDTVTAGFWVYDTTSGSPSGRIWGHYTDDDTDIDSYVKSASGNNTYSGTDGTWTYLEYTWTFDSSSSNGLVIEARTYSSSGDTIWVDDITVTAPDGATIMFAGGAAATVPVPSAMLLLGSGLVALAGIRRKNA